MILFLIFIGVIVVSLFITLFMYFYNKNLPDMKFFNDEYDVSRVKFVPRNLLEEKVK